MSSAVRITLGLIVGVSGGYGLSRLLCLRGGCPLTSNRPLMMVVGGLLGLWLAVGGCSSAKTSRPTNFGKELTSSEQFKAQVIDPGRPAVVDFYAPWCGPCQRLEPILAELEKQYEGRVSFYRVDVDRAGQLAAEHNVRGVPTLAFYRSGQRVDQVVGFAPKAALARQLDKLLSEG